MTTTICLNMIVKNESRIIERVLSSVSDIIDCYCIEDTGSTDDTKEIITQFFKEKQIPGKIVEEPFQHFAYNRTHALQSATGMAEYLLFIDADMILECNLSKDELHRKLKEHQVFHVFQGSPVFYYKNVRFSKNDGQCKYITPTHEYFAPPPHFSYGFFTKEEIFINDKGDGGSKENKTKRDIQLLKDEMEKTPHNERCTFYLANSYRDLGEHDTAIAFYKKRVELGGWIEEQWYSLYEIGNIYSEMGEDAKSIYYWLEAFNKYPRRIENLYKIIRYYRCRGNNELASHFFYLADNSRTTYTDWGDYLFLQSDIYEYKLDFEQSIFGYYVRRTTDLCEICMKVISHPLVEENILNNVLMNYKFYSTTLANLQTTKLSPAHPFSQISKVAEIIFPKTVRDETYGELVSSTPSICMCGTETLSLVVCVRYVNYKINEKGGYENGTHIVSKNKLAVLVFVNNEWKVEPINGDDVMEYDISKDGLYVGLEDVRLFCNPTTGDLNSLYYNANRGTVLGEGMKVEHGWIRLGCPPHTEKSKWLSLKNRQQKRIEKNWVLFGGNTDNDIYSVYGWNPLIIGRVEDAENADDADDTYSFNILQETTHKIPKFFERVRGSSNGVAVGENEIWFLCHLVSYEERRHYYHLFVVLEKTNGTFALKKYTELFTFRGEKVEYSLGFVVSNPMDHNPLFLIGYSCMDNTTQFMTVEKNRLEGMMIKNN